MKKSIWLSMIALIVSITTILILLISLVSRMNKEYNKPYFMRVNKKFKQYENQNQDEDESIANHPPEIYYNLKKEDIQNHFPPKYVYQDYSYTPNKTSNKSSASEMDIDKTMDYSKDISEEENNYQIPTNDFSEKIENHNKNNNPKNKK
ncbi:MAG: hypothetical protein KFW09_04535 [Oscillospiraceae bacterium]|nr:hypothetical protein [Oscillospiraceae bacterium]